MIWEFDNGVSTEAIAHCGESDKHLRGQRPSTFCSLFGVSDQKRRPSDLLDLEFFMVIHLSSSTGGLDWANAFR